MSDGLLALPPLTPGATVASHPLCAAQLQWLESDLFAPHEHWMPIVWRLSGPLDPEALRLSVRDLIERHEVLRTVFDRHGSGSSAIVRSADEVPLPAIDMTELDIREAELEIWARLRPTLVTPPSISHGVFRLELYRLADEEHRLAGFVHHIALDGSSLKLMMHEVMDGYYRRLYGEPPQETPRLQFGDFAAWEASWLDGSARAAANTTWDELASDVSPIDFGAAASGLESGAEPRVRTLELWAGEAGELSRTASRIGATTAVLAYAAVALSISRCLAREDVIFSVAANCRPPQMAGAIGGFMQLRPFVLRLDDDPVLSEVVTKTRTALAAVSNIRLPVGVDFWRRCPCHNVIVNYARRTSTRTIRRSDDVSSSPAVRSGRGGNTDMVSVDASTISWGAPQNTPDGYLTASLGSTARRASEPRRLNQPGRLQAEMARLPRRLQTEFHRDLHLAIDEFDDRLSLNVTFRTDRVGDQVVAELCNLAPIALTQLLVRPEAHLSQLFD